MKLSDYSSEELKDKSLIEIAKLVLDEEKKDMHFKDLFARLAEIRGLTEAQKKEKIVQFYTDLNIEGRFITLGSNMWGLKRWYPVEKLDEQIVATPKSKKKKAAEEEADTEVEPEAEGLDVVDGDMEEIVEGFEGEELEDDDPEEVLDEDFGEEDAEEAEEK